MGTKHFKKQKFMVHDKKTEVSDKRMKSNWNNKHQKEQFLQRQNLKALHQHTFVKKISLKR